MIATRQERRRSPLAAIGGWSSRHPWLALAIWLTFVAGAVGALSVTGSKQLQNGAVGESARGYTLLDNHHIDLAQHGYAYLHSDRQQTTDPAFRAAIARVSALMQGALGSTITTQVSHDGHSALVGGVITQPFDVAALERSVQRTGSAAAGLTASIEGAISRSGNNDLKRAEQLSLPVTLLVLLFAFGAIVAALVPVLLAATAVVAAFGLLGPISQVFPLDDSVKTVVLLIGMAVGVDYALFYVVRSREERRRGLTSHDALERTARTSGRTVAVAGATVAIAMAAQFAIGSDIFNGIAAGTIAVVACAVAGSVTVLPAILELLGKRIDRGRIPFLPHLHTDSSDARFWPGLIDRVLRRPLLAFVLAASFLVALAVPALSLHVADPSSDALSRQTASVAKLAAQFPNSCGPDTCTRAYVVATIPHGSEAAVMHAAEQLEHLALARGISHPPFDANTSGDGQAAAVALPLAGLGDNAAGRRAIRVLRDELIPQTLGRIPGVETAVTGDTAEDVDFTNQMKHGVPYVIVFVLALAFVLLLVAFRSLVVPLKAIALNLLSVAASYGVLVLVFQHHWAEGLLGFHSNGAIMSWLPLFLFVVLFGLSMDYHVFILSRVREGVDAGLSTDDALRQGITRTAGVVTSAALVMVGVFSLFGTASALDLKQAGVGLAVAILLDATVIRGVLLPASMKLLGERNWYLPRGLEWLPRADHGDHELPSPAAASLD
jgi:RND superfamily putative drug exporter